MSTTVAPARELPADVNAGVPTAATEETHSRMPRTLGIAFLAVGFLIDLAAFSAALMILDDQMHPSLAIAIAVGASLMALFLMFEAGHLEGKRRRTTKGRHGRGIINALMSVWLMAGVAATYIRLTARPASATAGGGADAFAGVGGSPDPFAGAAGGAADPFGSASADMAGSTTGAGIDLGFTTIYPESVPMALFMFVLYLGVGVSAYVTGLHFEEQLAESRLAGPGVLRRAARRPGMAWSARRHRKALERARRDLVQVSAERDAVATGLADLAAASEHVEAQERQLQALQVLEASLMDLEAARRDRNDVAMARAGAHRRVAQLEAELAALDGQVEHEMAAAKASGAIAADHARAVLYRALGQPARTVMDSDAAGAGPATTFLPPTSPRPEV